jgi:[protein-PII] uridylyltransferase
MSTLPTRIAELRGASREAIRRAGTAQREGESGVLVANLLSDQRRKILTDYWTSSIASDGGLLESDVALVVLGSLGRRDTAPDSDVDVMLLTSSRLSGDLIKKAGRFFRDLNDAGLSVGHSIRTPEEACSLAVQEASIATSLIDADKIAGPDAVWHKFQDRFQSTIQRRRKTLIAAIEKERADERIKFGESVYLLEPNVKRSPGGLRDLQLLGWIGQVAYGTSDPLALAKEGVLTAEEAASLLEAEEYLLRLRNSLHYEVERPDDVLTRSEQQRLAVSYGYAPQTGILPVERFMRDYFRRTQAIHATVGRVVRDLHIGDSRRTSLSMLLGSRFDDDFIAGASFVAAKPEAEKHSPDLWTFILRLLEAANLIDKPIHPATWDRVRHAAADLPADPTEDAKQRFLNLIQRPARLGELLRGLHESSILEKLIPGFAHARGLLQFNQYHKYTVDEHCLRALEYATSLASKTNSIAGEAYRAVVRKDLLHLAILSHDLGKGLVDEHREESRRLAVTTAQRLDMNKDDVAKLEFLVYEHETMNNLAFRRDTSDPNLILQFAVDVGSAERLAMLYIITLSDLAAVGPDVLTKWKEDVLTMLFLAAREQLIFGEEGVADLSDPRDAIRDCLTSDPLFDREASERIEQVERLVSALPASICREREPEEAAACARLLWDLDRRDVRIHIQYHPETRTADIVIAAHDFSTSDVFQRVTGALAGLRLEVLSAEFHSMPPLQEEKALQADSGILSLVRFVAEDPEFHPSAVGQRIDAVVGCVRESLRSEKLEAPRIRKTLHTTRNERPIEVAKTSVRIDNSTSEQFTILDIFATDRPGLLYRIAKTLHELRLTIARAKVGSHVDQVVDVFYVCDENGDKVTASPRIEVLRLRLMQVLLKSEE